MESVRHCCPSDACAIHACAVQPRTTTPVQPRTTTVSMNGRRHRLALYLDSWRRGREGVRSCIEKFLLKLYVFTSKAKTKTRDPCRHTNPKFVMRCRRIRCALRCPALGIAQQLNGRERAAPLSACCKARGRHARYSIARAPAPCSTPQTHTHTSRACTPKCIQKPQSLPTRCARWGLLGRTA